MVSVPAVSSANVINVVDFGARGDGTGDNLSAIQAAVDALKKNNGGVLYFPKGQYRIATSAHGAVYLNGISNAVIRFEPGTVLLMDNLQSDGMGGGHGVVLRGPASDILLENIHVKWVKKAAGRSHGDAFRFEGYPDDSKTLARITMNNCIGENSPQTGAVFMGCSDVSVSNFKPVNTWADGLHFNACRRVNVNGVQGINNGDDTLAFVTYYDKEFFGETGTIFAFPTLTEWNNFCCNAVNITSIGGHADGMRISGGRNINVSNLNVVGKWAGFQLDSALKTTDSNAVGWSYLASRNINISNVTVSGCDYGAVIRSLNVMPKAEPDFWNFSLNISNMMLSDIKSYGIDVQSAGGIQFSKIVSVSKLRFFNLRGTVMVEGLEQTGNDVELYGIQAERFFGYKPNRELMLCEVNDPDEVAIGKVRFNHINLNNSPLKIGWFAGLHISDFSTDGEIDIRNSREIHFIDSAVAAKPTMQKTKNITLNKELLQ